MATKGVNGIAVASGLVGGVFAYSAIKGISISTAFRDLLTGKNPASEPKSSTLAITGGTFSGTTESGTPITGNVTPPNVSGSGWQPINAYLKQQGFNKYARAGALGNMQVESGFNPSSFNAGEGAIGICQWEGGRRAALQQYAKLHGSTETDLNMQLGFMALELITSKAGVRLQLLAVGNVDTAATIWQSQYEVSTPDSLPQRIANARAFLAVV